MLTLSAYQYAVKFKTTDKHANVDGLSPLLLNVTTEEDVFTSLFNWQQLI